MGSILGLVLLSACASGNPDRSAHVQRVSKGIGAALQTDGPADASLPPGVQLDDGVSADEAVKIALWNNPGFRSRLLEVELARAGLVEASGLPDPVLGVVFPGDATQWKGTLSWPLQLLQMPARIRSARAGIDAAVQVAIVDGLALERDVLLAYTRVQLADEAERIVSEDAVLAARLADIADERARVGRISMSNADMEAAASAQAKVQLAQVVREKQVAQSALLRLMGWADSSIRLDAPVQDNLQPAPDLAQALRAAQTGRADIRAAQLRVQDAAAQAGFETAGIVSLSALIDFDKQPGQSLSVGPGASVSIPVFNANRPNRLRAGTNLERSTLEFRAIQEQAADEVRQAHASLVAATESLRAIRDQVEPAARRLSERSDQAATLGRESQATAAQQRRVYLSALLARSRAQADYHGAWAQLRHSMGETQTNAAP
jgi:outer membrane protein, heavy metal efflux system